MEETKLSGPVEYIKEAWGIYTKKENFIFFAKIMAVLSILSAAVGYIVGYFYPAGLEGFDYSNIPMLIGFILISIISIILSFWTQTTQYYSILKIGSSEVEIFRLGFKKSFKFFLISLTVGLIILLGLVLLIIPAILFGVWYSFSIWLVMDKDMKIGEALKTSKAMVKGRFWKVLGRSFVFGLFSFFVSLIFTAVPYAGSLLVSFLAPLFMLPFYLMYKDLVTNTN